MNNIDKFNEALCELMLRHSVVGSCNTVISSPSDAKMVVNFLVPREITTCSDHPDTVRLQTALCVASGQLTDAQEAVVDRLSGVVPTNLDELRNLLDTLKEALND